MADATGNHTRSPEEIERDIAAERQQLHDTIDEALSRFTFEDAWNRAGGYLKENRSEFGHSFGRVLRERPMGVMLTAVGLAWLFFGPKETARRRSFSSRRLADERARDRREAEREAYLAEEGEAQAFDRKPGVSDLPDEPPVEPTRPVSSPVSTGVSPTPGASGSVPVTPQQRDSSAPARGSDAVRPASMTPSASSGSTSAGEPMKSADHSPDPAAPPKESEQRL